jgi:uncharacterized membrane protein YidH (DUF202 family)
MKYLTKPIYVNIVNILLIITSSILLFTQESIALFLVAIAMLLMIISLVHSIVTKKWKRLFSYIFIDTLLAISMLFVILVIGFLKPNIIIGTEKFYANRLQNHISFDYNNDLKIVCKKDTIYGIGPGGSDYNANCLYKITNSQASYLINKLNEDNNYERIKVENFKQDINLKELSCNKNIDFEEYGYDLANSNSMCSLIFSKNKQYVLLYISYF